MLRNVSVYKTLCLHFSLVTCLWNFSGLNLHCHSLSYFLHLKYNGRTKLMSLFNKIMETTFSKVSCHNPSEAIQSREKRTLQSANCYKLGSTPLMESAYIGQFHEFSSLKRLFYMYLTSLLNFGDVGFQHK